MVTTEIFEKLKSLQVILGRKYELESNIEEAPKQLGSQDELLATLKKEFIEKSNERDSVKSIINSLSIELDEAVKTKESGEKSMDNITTHREYEALDKQISEASLREAEIRKELSKEEKKLSELEDEISSTKAMIDSQENDLNISKAALDSQISEYKAELETLKAEEAKITPDLDQEILFKFQRIIQRNSEGIVAVKNSVKRDENKKAGVCTGVCTGCNMILPAQFVNEVHEGDSILFCPYCSRILYYVEAKEDSQETFFNDAGSLSDLDDDYDIDDEYAEDEENEGFEDEDIDSEFSYDDEDDEESDEEPEDMDD